MLDQEYGAGLSTLEYAPLAEIMGRPPMAPAVFNCSAPDTGNMVVLARYGPAAQKERWLQPRLAGTIRSCVALTEPQAASSDATNIPARMMRAGAATMINGHKWWIAGVGDPRCRSAIVMGQTDPPAAPQHRQSLVLVPMDTLGVTIPRMLTVFGYNDAPHGHGEILFTNVRVQARVAFGRPRAAQGTIRAGSATSRIEIERARLLTLTAADRMDRVGNKAA